jgi:hypothetical protein
MSWRDHLPIHPAADLFPLMSESELRELGEDIKKNGLLSPIIIDGDDGKLVDGRNRLDAIALVGMEFEFVRAARGPTKGKIVGIDSDDFETPDSGAVRRIFDFEANPYDFVLSANLHRRHLTGEQKRELIAKVLKAKPEASNTIIAKQTKTTDKTVAKVRRKLESTSEIPKLEKTTGADGKKRGRPPKRKVGLAPPRPPQPEPEAAAPLASGSAEISIEQRRAEYAALDTVTDLDRRIIRAAGAIRHEAMGLTQSDTERFVAAIRDQIDSIEREALQADADLSIPEFLRRTEVVT